MVELSWWSFDKVRTLLYLSLTACNEITIVI